MKTNKYLDHNNQKLLTLQNKACQIIRCIQDLFGFNNMHKDKELQFLNQDIFEKVDTSIYTAIVELAKEIETVIKYLQEESNESGKENRD